MKLVRFSVGEGPARLGALDGHTIRDFEASSARSMIAGGVPASEAQVRAHAVFGQGTRVFLEREPEARALLAAVSDWDLVPVASARLRAPIADPGKIICIGLNYRDHAEEAGMAVPPEPPLFAKFANSVLDPGAPIRRPRGCQQLDWEVELAVVIGHCARHVPPERALDGVFGYTVVNDVSARDFQFVTSQWGKGKMADTFLPMGPCIADRDEISDPHDLALRAWVNDALMQQGRTRTLVYDVRYLVSYLSGLMTLNPGDIIATGTPPGVGMGRKPPVWMQPGDVCRVEIDRIGAVANPVEQEL